MALDPQGNHCSTFISAQEEKKTPCHVQLTLWHRKLQTLNENKLKKLITCKWNEAGEAFYREMKYLPSEKQTKKMYQAQGKG